MGSGGPDLNRDPEEGMGSGRADAATIQEGGKEAQDYEFGMGSGRPASEEGMGIIPGHHKKHEGGHEQKEGGGLLKKVENVFHHDKN